MEWLRKSCEACRESISAELDGEPCAVSASQRSDHLAVCPACRSYEAEAAAHQRRFRIVSAESVPDLTARVQHAIGSSSPPHRAEPWLRLGLVLVALTQIAIAVPALIMGDDARLPVHAARHLGSFDVALAVGFLFAAWRPYYIRGLIPVATAVVVCILGTAVLDVIDGRTHVFTELHHTPEVLGLVFAYLLAFPTLRLLKSRPSLSHA